MVVLMQRILWGFLMGWIFIVSCDGRKDFEGLSVEKNLRGYHVVKNMRGCGVQEDSEVVSC